ncbi:MAG: GxxExxY protein [Bdellovibrionota bacterium]
MDNCKSYSVNDNRKFFNHPLTRMVIGCAIEVHKQLGPGLLESTYEKCLAYEFDENNIEYVVQASLPVYYKEICIDCGYRLDFLVENFIVVELKSVAELNATHMAQTLTYMKLAEVPLGLLFNFNKPKLTDGIRKLVLE